MSAHVLVLLENEPYPHDRRVVQEAEALSAAGYRVTVLGPTGFGFNLREEMIDGTSQIDRQSCVTVRQVFAASAAASHVGFGTEYLFTTAPDTNAPMK